MRDELTPRRARTQGMGIEREVFVSADGYRMAAREFDAPKKTLGYAVPK